MNSETSPIPESDNKNSQPLDLENEPSSDRVELEVDSDSTKITDVWSEDDDVIDLSVSSDSPLPVEVTVDESVTIESQGNEPETTQATETEISPTETAPEVELTDEVESEISPPEDSKTEPELFVDSWLDEPETKTLEINTLSADPQTVATDDQIKDLEAQKASLQQEIEALKAQKEQLLLQQVRDVQESMGRMVEEGTKELKERKTALYIEIEKLERRQERINQEMRRNFAGSSQELAVRVQGFKDYLVGSLQDLVTAAEKLELARTETAPPKNRERVRSRDIGRDDRDRDRGRRRERNERNRSRNSPPSASPDQFGESNFAQQGRRIRQLLDQYRNSPDYYGSPWQLRRTFEPIHAQKVQEWFFTQGGRGAIDSMGSRLQNILIASAAISILYNLYSDRCRFLILTDTPENLGEWRRGLQDCLGIARSNFGSNRGVVLFDSPEVLVQRAERLMADKLLPVIIVDETEELLNLSVLKFPIWMAFASKNKPTSSNYLY